MIYADSSLARGEVLAPGGFPFFHDDTLDGFLRGAREQVEKHTEHAVADVPEDCEPLVGPAISSLGPVCSCPPVPGACTCPPGEVRFE